jgi:hypothetical protein
MAFISFFTMGSEELTYVNVQDISAVERRAGDVVLFLRSTSSKYVVDAQSPDAVVRAAWEAAKGDLIVQVRHVRSR